MTNPLRKVMQLILYQVIKRSTLILDNYSTCLHLTFKSYPNLTIESSAHPFWYPNFHHQIVYAKFHLQIHFTSPDSHEVWHYKDANTDLKKRAIQ